MKWIPNIPSFSRFVYLFFAIFMVFFSFMLCTSNFAPFSLALVVTRSSSLKSHLKALESLQGTACTTGVLLGRVDVKKRKRLFNWPCLIWRQSRRWRKGVGKGEKKIAGRGNIHSPTLTPIPFLIFFAVAHPLGTNFFLSQPSAVIKINFR